ncbi:histidine phosphatase family protein [Faecalibacterium sp. An77]|uniref:histidine phosphatase family protein n=1 Tax=Faecalibacterium sp. An77 TaxID=1965655 RepID=UPI000B37C51A|nr:histidine phosphatase family protein [Faecalibacterium sp. An77]OUN40591.1 histidine phosphatase family protein [Faecalibacterium sp. An77]
MKIYLLRHGVTEYNTQKRYQGQRDIPLSTKGRAMLRRADFDPEVVYVSPLTRARQTAKILFPEARQVVVPDLREMNFGTFEGRNYIEMEQDPDYLAWVASNCESTCPDGERKEDFSARVCAAFARLVDQAFAEGKDQLVILAHGGTQMASMERYALPRKTYHEWCGPNAGGFVLEGDADTWQKEHHLQCLGTVQYTRPEAEC